MRTIIFSVADLSDSCFDKHSEREREREKGGGETEREKFIPALKNPLD